MARRYHRLLLLFVDGVGLAPAGADNPFSEPATPAIDDLLGGPLTFEQATQKDGRVLIPLDACLGVEGLPQSATGQTTLFTGVNAAARMGRHVTGLPGPSLRRVVEGEGLLLRAAMAGRRVTFANAYSGGYLEALAAGTARPSVTTCMTQAANSRLRTLKDLRRGRAITWDITGDLFGLKSGPWVAEVTPHLAGQRLAAVARDHDLTIFETFLPDLAGHGRVRIGEREVLGRLDGLLAGALEAVGEDLTVVLTSDHGNFESRSARGHTHHSVPLLAVGPAAGAFAGARCLADVAPRMLSVLAAGGRS